MSVGKPYYSDFHPDVKSELKFRSECSLVDTRSTEQLDWLTARSSWGSITLLSSDKTKVQSAINNKSLLAENNPTNSGNWQGYLGLTNLWNNSKNLVNSFKGQIQTFGRSAVRSYNATDSDYLADNLSNSVSGRTKPVLQQINITLRDNATGTQGVLNNATVTILIPDIEFFQDVFEPQWHRIGIHAVIEVGHSIRLDERANYGRFTGAMTNFSFEYQTDATVKVTMEFIAITEIFTEVPGKNIIKAADQSKSKKTKQLERPDVGKQLITKNTLMQEINDLFIKYLPGDSLTDIGESVTHVLNPNFEQEYISELDSDISVTSRIARNKTYTQEKIESYYLNRKDKDFNLTESKINGTSANEIDGVTGNEFNSDKQVPPYYCFLSAIRKTTTSENNIETEERQGTEGGIRYYLSLGTLLKLINVNIYMAWRTSVPEIVPSAVTATPELVTSLYYPELVSADHKRVILPGEETSTYITQSFGILDTFTENSYTADAEINFYTSLSNIEQTSKTSERKQRLAKRAQNLQQDKIVGIIPHIMLSTEMIQEVFAKYNAVITSLDDNDKFKPDEMSIANLLAMIGLVIKESTGNAINLKLSPFPESYVSDPNAPSLLLYRDVNAIEDNSIKYFSMPMFSTSKKYISNTTNILGKSISKTEPIYNRQGTVIRSFKLTGELTTAMKVAAIVGTYKGSRDQAAPLMKYIYSDSDEAKKQTEQEYEQASFNALEFLEDAKAIYEQNPDYNESVAILSQALKDYIYTPVPTLKKLNKFIRPIAPISAELTLDGIYGLRFGDVFILDGLPPRYENFVFYVTKISHTLDKQDWSTTINCQLRVRLK